MHDERQYVEFDVPYETTQTSDPIQCAIHSYCSRLNFKTRLDRFSFVNLNSTKLLEIMDAIYAYVNEHQNEYVAWLKETVAIRSVSASVEHRPEVAKMGQWLIERLTSLGCSVETRHPGTQTLQGIQLDLPPVVLATYGTDSNKKTVLVYGHYDVQPALKEDGWNTDPWVLTEVDGQLFGRGSTDDKAPILGWLWVLDVHQKLKIDLPVNLKMCFEGMEESGSEGLDDIVYAEASRYFKNVDCVCISDNYWLGTTKPCLTYGLRGVSTFELQVSGPGRDLHSGVFGGTVHEPMTDLVQLMATLVDSSGRILVPGIMDSVAPVTEEEKALYKGIEFSLADIHNAAAAKNTIHDTATEALMGRWRFPSLSLHGIEGAYYAPGAKTVIPAKVIGKFSIRSVPNQEPVEITRLVKKHLEAKFAMLGSKNTIAVTCDHAGKWWVANPDHWSYGKLK